MICTVYQPHDASSAACNCGHFSNKCTSSSNCICMAVQFGGRLAPLANIGRHYLKIEGSGTCWVCNKWIKCSGLFSFTLVLLSLSKKGCAQ